MIRLGCVPALAPDWKWARPVLDPALGITADYGRVEPTPTEPSPDLRAVLDDLAQREDNLANVTAEDWSADHEAEAEEIAARQEERKPLPINGLGFLRKS